MRSVILLLLPFIFALLIGIGCSHTSKSPISPTLEGVYFIASDQQRLPYRKWLPPGKPVAVVIALHGFNDYSRFFTSSGSYLASQGVASYAFDQRGFGGTEARGRWAGSELYQRDLKEFIRLVRAEHPQTPLYILGESMGGAVAMVTLAHGLPEGVDGMILAAPAVWNRDAMPWYQNLLLWTSGRIVPWLTVTGSGLKITPSDNEAMLWALAWDPLVIRETRIDAIEGLVDLMDEAQLASSQLTLPTLVLYGDRDEIIPKAPMYQMLRERQKENPQLQVGFYRDGYHMLLRDLQADLVLDDVAAWVRSPGTPLPSGAGRHAHDVLSGLGVVQYPDH